MKKVLFVATVDSHILQFHLPYLKMFKEKGYKVFVATNGNEAIPYCDEKIKISVQRSPIKIKNLKAIKELKKVIEKEKFDIIHCHTPMGSVVTRLAAKKERKNGTKVIYTAHGFHFYRGAPLKNWLIFYPIEKYLSRFTDCLITINEEDYNLAKRKFKASQIELVHGVGIDETKFNFEMSEEEKIELRKSLGLEKVDFVIIYPAELSKRKNQKMAIDVMSELVKDNKKVKLLLPGLDSMNGKYQKYAQQFNLKENVKFLCYRKDINKLMKISNLAISTSKQEGLPVNIMEAMACGLPIVATDCRGNRDLVQDGKNGIVVEVDDTNKMKDKIKEIMNSKELINFFKETDKELIKQYLLEDIKGKMKEIYGIEKKTSILFIHGAEKLKEDDKGNYYTDGSYTKEVWDRYLSISKCLTVIFRKEDIIYDEDYSLKKFQIFDKNKIKFVKVKDIRKSILTFLSLKIRKINKKIIKQEVLNSDLIIARVPSKESYIAIDYAKKFNKKYIVEVVACAFDSLWYHSLKGKIFAISEYFKMKYYVKKAPYVTYVSSKFLQKRYPTKGKSLSCSDVVINNINDIDLKNRLERINNKNNNKLILGTVGAVNVKYKGQQYVIKAISKLNKEGYNFEYHIVGGGDNTYLKNVAKRYQVEDKVKFIGSLEHDKVFEFMRNIDIYIQPSNVEGLCRSLIEAMSVACPCIVSDAGGNYELVNKENIFRKRKWRKVKDKLVSLSCTRQKKEAKIVFNMSKQFLMQTLNKKRNNFYKKIIREE